MIRKMKRTVKKNKGLELRIKREEFLQELKNPTTKAQEAEANEILKKIRQRAGASPTRMGKPGSNPYNAGAGGAMDNLLKKIRTRTGIK